MPARIDASRGMFRQSTQGRRRGVRVTRDRVVGHNDSIRGLGRCARRGSSNLTRPTLPSPSASRLVMAGLRDVVESSARAAPRPRSGCTNCMAVGSARERELPRSLSKCGRSSGARQEKRNRSLEFFRGGKGVKSSLSINVLRPKFTMGSDKAGYVASGVQVCRYNASATWHVHATPR